MAANISIRSLNLIQNRKRVAVVQKYYFILSCKGSYRTLWSPSISFLRCCHLSINLQIKWFITRFLIKLSPTQIFYWSPISLNWIASHQLLIFVIVKSNYEIRSNGINFQLNMMQKNRGNVFQSIKIEWKCFTNVQS